jgi:nitrogen fixation/metabolism regulation signal transduction histidine kinase
MGIKLKLISFFIVFKIIPLVIIVYITIQGANKLDDYFSKNTKTLFEENKKLLESTAQSTIKDSIVALDKKSQEALEKLSVGLANQVADFLYERDKDILFLSTFEPSQRLLENFYATKTRPITIHGDYYYNEKTKQWANSTPPSPSTTNKKAVILKDNNKEFHYVNPKPFSTQTIPIYKEVVFLDLVGQERYKKSSINPKKQNVSIRSNTYCKAEDYFSKISQLKKGEIYVSDVIGAYVGSKVIGAFTKEKAKKMGVDFDPTKHGYAGAENPKGKPFEGIIRFITPVFKKGEKIGYISLALDHRHIMEYTDTFNPIDPNIKQDIANAGAGNYAFMWDYEARNISHPRDYFIVGFDPNTGERVPGWISKDIADKFNNSKQKDLNQFLSTYPTFEDQSLEKKPNIAQLKQKGEIGLDCRYLNFAPQCQGWMEATKNGGYGSFIIFWSKVWKLTTAATIPYYTGQYANTKRGFGFVTIGANVDQFHLAANKTKENIGTILTSQNEKLEKSIEDNTHKITLFINELINELSIVTILMIIIMILLAIWMSNYLTQKIDNLIEGTKEFAKNNLDHKIKITSNDEIGQLESAFNTMSEQLQTSLRDQKEKEFELIQKSKMAEVGEMMSAIIHQWKQPITVIKAKTSSMTLLNDIGEEIEIDLAMDTFKEIEGQADLMNQTIEDFRNFTKPSSKKTYQLFQITQQTYNLLNKVFESHKIKINLIKTSDTTTLGYPNEVIQVLINILNNARDAILENNCEVKIIDVEVKNEDQYGIITITDYAGGIPEEIMEKIFDPYFTTKSDDKGTGIGLDMSSKMIQKANGALLVKNIEHDHNGKIHQGAQFTIKLLKEENDELKS